MGRVLPIGTPGGIVRGFRKVPDGSGVVRLGGDLVFLGPHLYQLWIAAAAAPRSTELITWAIAESMVDVPDLLSDLDAAGLLVEGKSNLRRSMGRLSARLTGELVGNALHAKAYFVALGQGGMQVELDPYSFDFLLRTDGVSPIESFCKSNDQLRKKHKHGDSVEAISDNLPVLVRAGVIRLDLATAP